MEFSFEDFKKRATDNSLSKWEKIGFPDSYRKDIEGKIFEDIDTKVDLKNAQNILDIGCGCSELVNIFIKNAQLNNQQIVLIDSAEMLNNITLSVEEKKHAQFLAGYFPSPELMQQLSVNSFDVIVVYSVIQYVFLEQSIFNFIHQCINLLKSGGRLLIGDIPNYQSRERFLNSVEGLNFLKNNNNPTSVHIQHEHEERIDDAVIVAILQRFRNFGCETYLLPQAKELPFANRREDILIVKR